MDTKELRKLLNKATRAKAKFDAMPKEGAQFKARERDRAFFNWRYAADDLRDQLEANAAELLDAAEKS